MRIAEAIEYATRRLKKAGIAEAAPEAAIILEHLLQVNRAGLILAADRAIEPSELRILDQWLTRRERREPLAYVLGEKEFWSLHFKVTDAVLIPRPETEFLLETALQMVRRPGKNSPTVVADLGVGSGAVAVVLARELPDAVIYGVDVSHSALLIAAENIRAHQVEDRVLLLNTDWLAALRPDQQFDLVVSNPPYIARRLLDPPFGDGPDDLMPEVRRYEPRCALDGGQDGTASIGNIAARLNDYLKPGGWVFLEIGADQGNYVTQLFRELNYADVKVYNDYAGLPRVLQARRHH